MEANKILHADLIDIIFEKRNKDYGAYELRKAYNYRLQQALGIMFILVCIIFYFVSQPADTRKALPVFIPDPETVNVKDAVLPVEPEAQPLTPRSQSTGARANRGNPVIVTSITPTDVIPPGISFPGSGAEPGPGINTNPGPSSPAVDTTSATPASNSNTPPSSPQVHTSVQVQAAFPGGMGAWRRYLQKNLDADSPVSNGAPPGTYRVIVRFIVSTDGSISDVVAETSHGYGMEKEAVNAIKRGPSWTPAQQNGMVVNAYRRQPITFVVPE